VLPLGYQGGQCKPWIHARVLGLTGDRSFGGYGLAHTGLFQSAKLLEKEVFFLNTCIHQQSKSSMHGRTR